MENQIYRQSASLELQAKEGMDKINPRDLPETSVINYELQNIMDTVKNIDQDQIRPM